MKFLVLLLALISSPLLDVSVAMAQDSKKEIIGYLPNWAAYRRNRIFNPTNIDYSKYTILNYSFFSPDSTGKIKSCDSYADKFLLYSEPNVVSLAHRKGVKVMASMGGWSLSTNFSKVASTQESREYFAQECVRIIKMFEFDGIDIDWEYPTYEQHGGNPEDTENFTLLLGAIRQAIDEYGTKVGEPMLLTAAVGAAPDHFESINWADVCEHLDYVNLMAYAANGIWSDHAGHNAPLTLAKDSTGVCTKSSVEMITQKYGVPMSKLNVGLPFYGISFLFNEGEAALHSDKHLKKSDEDGCFKITKGTPSYFDILEHKDKFDEFWDDDCQVPYLLSKDRSVFVTFDNEKSLKLKAEYVKEINAAGVILWDISHDYVETKPGSGAIKGTPLATAVATTLGHDPKSLPKIKHRKVVK